MSIFQQLSQCKRIANAAIKKAIPEISKNLP